VAGLSVSLSRHDKGGIGELALASTITLATVYTLKPIVNRQRPDGGSRSFPSGHTAIAFAGAGFLHRRYGWAYGIPAYVVGAFVGYSRVQSKRHYTSDVLAGGAIGIASNLLVTKRYRGLRLAPTQTGSGPGLALYLSW
jgi:membrane-associated phospholipid phosphatase